MDPELRERICISFGLSSRQREAALEQGRDVVVTAGAGSGKTRTLVARYAALLADGLSPRQVVAITFTDKAAREMRARVRQAVEQLIRQASDDGERQRWVELNAEMDSARIGTIYSLCSEILRAQPVEAGIDPKFDIVDEGLAAALKAQLVEDTLTYLVGQPEFTALFTAFSLYELRDLLAFLLANRLEVVEAFSQQADGAQVIGPYLRSALENPAIRACMDELRGFAHADLLQDAGDRLAAQVEDLLVSWTAAEEALSAGDLIACVGHLFEARRKKMAGNVGGKNSRAKQIVKELKEAYDLLLDPVAGGRLSGDVPVDAQAEAAFTATLPLIRDAFQLLQAAYQKALGQRRLLDFDDLEAGAARLLAQPAIRAKWQDEISSVLVDEFQDTNERQRKIVEALAGAPGRLFIVGDARQSIYRFRRADVTVFREVGRSIQARQGLAVDLDETYRAHRPLLFASGDLLQAVMGTTADLNRPYYVPYAPLRTNREAPPKCITAPHVEFVFGAGEDSSGGRVQAARALAVRLHELKREGQILNWDEVTLLFRASTSFKYYENAFEETGIPFVTVAGRGFYDRPEIRDVINILRALADPGDDLAMAGLLRSPAFGLSDAALYQLRWPGEAPASFWPALHADLSSLSDADRQQAERALAILDTLITRVDRVPVADLLKTLIDATDYRAILAVESGDGDGGRLWRNLDKLLSDAQTSGQVNVRDFLDYLAVVNDAGAREGEAPSQAQGSLRLMTIHKSKGLEFPVVVLADASREPRGSSALAYLLPNLGLSLRMDPAPMLFRLSKWLDKDQEDAETQRLLYVALTRAKDKLIINAHATQNTQKEWMVKGWAQDLCAAAGIDVNQVVQDAGLPSETTTSGGYPVRAWAIPPTPGMNRPPQRPETPESEEIDLKALYEPLRVSEAPVNDQTEEKAARPHRASGSAGDVPAAVIGSMVHKALELWVFPGDPRLVPLLTISAQNAGIVLPVQQEAAVAQATHLLARLQGHPIRTEIEQAETKIHEVPYSRSVNEYAETGYIDLLFRTAKGWHIVDFKTNSILNPLEIAAGQRI